MHKHHIIPKHAGGTDDPANLILLTVEEHVEAHRLLWEQYGRWQDQVAWLSLSKQITGEEAQKMAVSNALKGKPKSIEQKKKMSEAHKRLWANSDREIMRRSWRANHKGMLGKLHSENTRLKISIARKKYWEMRRAS